MISPVQIKGSPNISNAEGSGYMGKFPLVSINIKFILTYMIKMQNIFQKYFMLNTILYKQTYQFLQNNDLQFLEN